MAEKIVVTIDGDTRGLQAALSDAEKETRALGTTAKDAGKESTEAGSKGERAWKRWGSAAAVAGKIASGVLAGIIAAGGATVALAADIDDLAKSARALDTSADELNRVQLALEQGGVSAGTATSALQSLERQLGRASTQGGPLADIVEDLGLSFEQLDEATPTESLGLLIDRLSQVDDGNARAYASAQLFRGASRDMNRIIAEGSGAFEGYLDNLSGVSSITNETAAESEELTNAVTLLKAEGGALIREFFEPLIPKVIDFVNATRTGVAELKALLGIAVQATGEVDRLDQRMRSVAIATAHFEEVSAELNDQMAVFGADDAGVVRLIGETEAAFQSMLAHEANLIATQEALGVATGDTADEVERYTIRTREAAGASADAAAVALANKHALEAEKGAYAALADAIVDTRTLEKEEAIASLEKQRELLEIQKQLHFEAVMSAEASATKRADLEREAQQTAIAAAGAAGRVITTIADAIASSVEEAALRRGASEEEAALAAFKANKAAGIINATISTALAVVNALAQVTYPANIVAAAAAGIAGGVQIGLIASQKPPAFHLGKSFASDETMALVRERERVLTPRGAQAIGGDAGVQAANAGMVSGASQGPTVLIYRADVFAEAQNDLSQSRGFAVQRHRPGANRPAAYTSAR